MDFIDISHPGVAYYPFKSIYCFEHSNSCLLLIMKLLSHEYCSYTNNMFILQPNFGKSQINLDKT